MLKIVKILEKLKIKNAYDVVVQIAHGSNLNYFYKLYHNFENMSGGTKEVKEFVTYKKATFGFIKYRIGDAIHYALHPNEDIDKSPECVLIIVDKVEKYASIHNISYHKDSKCITKTQAESIGSEKGGSILLKVSLALIDAIKDHYELKYVMLNDNSRKYCELIEESIDLDSFYMLIHGDTWYGKYGFEPFDTSLKKTNKLVLKDYKQNQKIVKKTLVKNTNIKKYILAAIKKYNLNLKISDIDKVMEKYNDQPIMKCLRDLSTKFDTNCAIFFYMYKKLMVDLNMKDLHGRAYWIKLKDDNDEKLIKKKK